MLKTSKASQILSFDQAIRKQVAVELSASFPIPVLEKGVLSYQAFYYHLGRTAEPATFKVYPPGWLATIDSAEGSLLTLNYHEPAFYGLEATKNEPFAVHKFEYPFAFAQLDGKIAEWQTATDALIPEWEENPSGRHAKPDYVELFRQLNAAPLLPCYRKLSGFFHWIGI